MRKVGGKVIHLLRNVDAGWTSHAIAMNVLCDGRPVEEGEKREGGKKILRNLITPQTHPSSDQKLVSTAQHIPRRQMSKSPLDVA